MRRLFAVFVVFFALMLPEAAYSGKNDIVIERGAEVLVRILDRLKSNNAQVGQTIRFLVERGVRNDDGFVLIPDGAHAYGKVTKVAKAGFFGAGGKLGITIDSVEAYNGTLVQLSGTQDNEGDNVTAFGAGIFRGTNAVIEAGTVFVAYVTNTTVLEERPDDGTTPAKQPAPAKQAVPAKAAQPAPAKQAVPVKVVRQAAPAPQPAQIPQPAPEKHTANQDKGYDFILVNKYGTTFSSIYIASAGKHYWHLEQDKVKGGNLKNGESMEINLPVQKSASYISPRKIRYCNLLIKLPSGKELQWTKVDFENVYKIEITKQDGKHHLTRFLQ